MANEEGWRAKFVPFASAIDSTFWVRYNREKLEKIKLSEDPIEIRGSFGVDGARMQFQETSLEPGSIFPNERVLAKGKLIGCNTVEAFQKTDKNKLLCDHFCEAFLSGDVSALTSFVLLTFADLKNHKVIYWFGFPALAHKSDKPIKVIESKALDESERRNVATAVFSMRLTALSTETEGLPPYFIYYGNQCFPLSTEAYQSLSDEEKDGVAFGFFDPVGATEVLTEPPQGWPLRNLVAFASLHLGLGGSEIKVLSYRPKRLLRLTGSEKEILATDLVDDRSIFLRIRVPNKEAYQWSDDSSDQYKVLGWELNARSKPGPRSVNLRPLLDSNHLAIQAADLNLKLMKWRMIPNLKVDLLQSTKVLIIGAGTLGCNVARVLLGWGIRKFKFVDYGRVGFSNPVRQPLFTLEDCHAENGDGKSKAAAAAAALKAIAADVESEGIVLSIPMPGHSEKRESVEESVSKLDSLMQECDVAFLLTDTRESRWLPTVMAAAHNKMLINAALGLDSWLVMRHGGGIDDPTPRLGCYFCNDIVAPENSTKNRTLDQQCTVTRPGLAPIASSMAVEMMVGLLHHPLTMRAPAPKASSSFSPTVGEDDESTTALGVVPHQIRGSLVTYTMMAPTVPAFQCCTGCASPVVEAYRNDKVGLVVNACLSATGQYLEDLSGLSEFRADAAAKLEDLDAWDEDDDFDA